MITRFSIWLDQFIDTLLIWYDCKIKMQKIVFECDSSHLLETISFICKMMQSVQKQHNPNIFLSLHCEWRENKRNKDDNIVFKRCNPRM